MPLSPKGFNLPIKIKRFTLFCSPLGNKKAKDQYEKREYCFYLCVNSKEASSILALLSVIGKVTNVKIKCSFGSKPA